MLVNKVTHFLRAYQQHLNYARYNIHAVSNILTECKIEQAQNHTKQESA